MPRYSAKAEMVMQQSRFERVVPCDMLLRPDCGRPCSTFTRRTPSQAAKPPKPIPIIGFRTPIQLGPSWPKKKLYSQHLHASVSTSRLSGPWSLDPGAGGFRGRHFAGRECQEELGSARLFGDKTFAMNNSWGTGPHGGAAVPVSVLRQVQVGWPAPWMSRTIHAVHHRKWAA